MTEEQLNNFLDTFCDIFNIKLFPYQRWFIKEHVLKQKQEYIYFSTYRRNRCDFRQLAYIMSVLVKEVE